MQRDEGDSRFLQPVTDDDQTAGLIAKNQVVAELMQSAHGATGRPGNAGVTDWRLANPLAG
jgi:hypothetical protein